MDADEIAKQLEKSRPITINARGEIVESNQTVQTPSGPVDRNTGQPVTELKPQRWYSWFLSNPRRLVDEQEVMRTCFPGFELHRLESQLTWVGWVKPQSASKAYKISIVYPDD